MKGINMRNDHERRALRELEEQYSAGKVSFGSYSRRKAQLLQSASSTTPAVRPERSRKKPFVVGIAVALAAVGVAGLAAHQTGAIQFRESSTVAPTGATTDAEDAQEVPDEEAHLLDEDAVDLSGGEVYLGEELDPLAYDRGYDFGHMRSYQGLTSNRSVHAKLCADKAREQYDSESNQSMYIQGCVTGGAGR